MFQRIILPVDLSDRHEPALELAAQLCQPGQGEVLLLHVVEVIPGLSMAEERPFYDRLEKVARERLGKLGRRLEEKKARWRSIVCVGHRVEQIAEYARQEQADLVVVTTPAADAGSVRAGLASLSFRVGLVAPCPVLLVRGSEPASRDRRTS